MDINERKKLIGKRLNTVLAMRNVKQKDLAKHLGIQDNAVSYFCKGDRTPNTAQLAEICDYLEISADYLLGRSEVASNSITVQQIAEKTGLSEKNIEDMILCNRDIIPGDLNDFLNFILQTAMDTGLVRKYIQMKEALHTPSIGPCVNAVMKERKKYFPEGISAIAVQNGVEKALGNFIGEAKGICMLSPEDAFTFYCMKISEVMYGALIRTYQPENQWGDIEGFKEDMIEEIQKENEALLKSKKKGGGKNGLHSRTKR